MKAAFKSVFRIKATYQCMAILLIFVAIVNSCSSDPEPSSAKELANDQKLPADVRAAMKNVPDTLDYNLHVKPILSDRCFSCHGPDRNKQKGGLRLDLVTAYDKRAESGRKAIVPGELDKSELFHRIISSDPAYMMPTPESHLSLTAQEKAILIKWIKQGAKYKKHWSLVAPQEVAIPKVKNSRWVQNPIDNFVLAKLEEKGLKPNQEASKETLLRRVSFDLIGLPPTIGELDGFLADKSPQAYEKAVDRLLRSPHFGERMAVDWLDLARYADTHGYQDDGMRNVYPWRDWVIRSFNKNLPYDQFVTWQLAGDLLPKPTRDQLVATCFLRNHPQSQEGGIVDEEYRVEYVADRVNTFGKAFLALSTECARCHDHKFDPISQKNYYQLFAFFNNNNESGEAPYTGEPSPSVILTKPETDKIIQFINKLELPKLSKELDRNIYRKSFELWLDSARRQPLAFAEIKKDLLGHFTFDSKDTLINLVRDSLRADLKSTEQGRMPKLVAGRFGNAIQLNGDLSIDFSKHLNFDRNQPFSLSMWINVPKGEFGPLFSRSFILDNWRGYTCLLNKNGTVSVMFSHVAPDNCMAIESIDKIPYGKWSSLVLTYDGSSKAKGINLYIDGKALRFKVINDNLRQSILFAQNKKRHSVHNLKIGRASSKTISNVSFDEFKAYKRELSVLEVKQLAGQPHLISNLLALAPSLLKPADKERLLDFYLASSCAKYDAVLAKIYRIREKENELLTDAEEIMAYKELKTPRPTFILDRGSYDAPRKRVMPSTPENVLAFDPNLPKNRLGLAKWLTSEKQPLFARVAVNRFWQQCFGQGIVKTTEDFGNQGEFPTHLELIDWLAITFRKEGWDVKKLLKMMVMSATYRQSSIPTAANLKGDPDNTLFSRAPSYRLSSEMIRDNALASSGLLVKTIGGKSVYPYQPSGVWESVAVRNEVTYKQGHGDSLYRRSLYTVWKRSSPHPAMINFDVPDRYACTVRRQKTSTPLQALVLLNDVQFVEASRVLAQNMIRKAGPSPNRQITYAFRALTSRYPKSEELKILLDLYTKEWSAFSKNVFRAKQLVQEGESGYDKRLNIAQLAACTVVANTLMNFDEFMTKR
ncbi:MAG: DUF1553 domain-containing protein [Pedobacter sp.]|nr:DUF1553 domain-containing protein [Pedobacter sp.]MDQ8052283.1 DUF1553 domain-containing protein [Pedobacter sp.]